MLLSPRKLNVTLHHQSEFLGESTSLLDSGLRADSVFGFFGKRLLLRCQLSVGSPVTLTADTGTGKVPYLLHELGPCSFSG